MRKSTGFYPRLTVDTAGSRGGVAGRCGAADRDDPHGSAWTGRCRRRWRRGGGRWRCTTRRRCCWIWRSRSRSAGTAWPTSPCCGPSRACSGTVASDPTVSRLIDTLAADARPGAGRDRHRPGRRPGRGCGDWPGSDAPDHGIDAEQPLIIDLDATLVTAHSEKERAAPTFKRGFGFHPLLAFVDHGPGGTGEPVGDAAAPGQRRHRTPPPITSP